MRYHYFDVRCGGAEERIAVGVEDQVWILWGLGGRANGQEIERRVTLGYLKEHLANTTTLASHRVLLTAWDEPASGEGLTVHRLQEQCPYERKECRYQERGKAGPLCAAAHARDPAQGQTTAAACERCGLPSTDILCDNVVYVETVGVKTDQTALAKRSLVDAQCNIGSEEFGKPGRDAKLCVPGSGSCWVQTYEVAEAVDVGPAVAGFSIAEAIDQVNAAFRSRYGRKLIVLEHARSIEDLAGDCPTDEAFQLKLQVLAGLLEGMDLSGLLTEEQAEDSQGTIDLLARLAARDFSTLPEQHVRTLRNINRLAAGYPRHAKVKNIERAHMELGLSYPLSDYPKAWAIVRETFIQTLRQLALHLG
jgi:hypothetical protein